MNAATTPISVATTTVTRTLAELESAIERGKQTFVEVGLALQEINKRQLYREQGFRSFEDYLRERWGWARRHGYELMAAASIVENVRSNAQSSPSLTQAVQLSSLPPDEQRVVASRVDFSTTTVRELKEKVRTIRPKAPVATELNISQYEVRRAPKSRKNLEKLIDRILKSYEGRSHMRVEEIRIHRDGSKPFTEVVERAKRGVKSA